MEPITEARARKLGYTITRGAYADGADDRLDRWYIQDSGDVVDRRGRGFATKREALESLTMDLIERGDL